MVVEVEYRHLRLSKDKGAPRRARAETAARAKAERAAPSEPLGGTALEFDGTDDFLTIRRLVSDDVTGRRVRARRRGHVAAQPPRALQEPQRPARRHVGPVDVVLGRPREDQGQPHRVHAERR